MKDSNVLLCFFYLKKEISKNQQLNLYLILYETFFCFSCYHHVELCGVK